MLGTGAALIGAFLAVNAVSGNVVEIAVVAKDKAASRRYQPAVDGGIELLRCLTYHLLRVLAEKPLPERTIEVSTKDDRYAR